MHGDDREGNEGDEGDEGDDPGLSSAGARATPGTTASSPDHPTPIWTPYPRDLKTKGGTFIEPMNGWGYPAEIEG
eukprot:746251-Hanusia_phi.AAC.4